MIVSLPVQASPHYTCPMHSHYIADEMGSCPICGMDLVSVAGEDDSEEEVDFEESVVKVQDISHYTCPMHPHYIADEMGSCPICGMDLVSVAGEGGADHSHHSHNHDSEVSTGPSSGSVSHKSSSESPRAVVKIAPEIIQNMGVRTEKVAITDFGKEVRSYGVITPNERLQKRIYSRVEGWITDFGVSAVGDEIATGGHLYTIYSPDLVLAQYDLLALDKSGRNTGLSKLSLHYQVDADFTKKLQETREIEQNVPYYSLWGGTVSMLNIRPGSHVTTSTLLMVIEDYSSVWVDVSVAEKDMEFLTHDSKARVVFSNRSNSESIANVDYIYPTISKDTRTGRIRLVLDNPDGEFKPGSYADVVFETEVSKRLAVPSEAVLRGSDGDFVVVSRGKGRFQPKKVVVGINNSGKTEIIKGINEGEDVVVSGQFMLDSESSMREVFRKMVSPKKSVNDSVSVGGAHVGH